uniref:RING-type E3 ubiquitin transferase n=1 Tax=Oryza meridionalis TaxID=40149 RepID=A0A0E0E2L4_9ORYZ
MLYLAGARWVLLLLASVTVLLCLQLPPRDNAVDGAAAAAADPAQTADLPLQQPAALPREAPAEGDLRGLGASSSSVFVVAVLPAYAWSKKAAGDGDGDGDGECAICLGEVRRGQVVKQLPACTHLFHARCIDKWLITSQGTCPVCRTPVDSAAAVAALQAVRVADQPP